MHREAEIVSELIRQQLGPAIQLDILAHLFGAYRETWNYAKEFDPPQRRKMYGHLRLSALEQSFKVLCRKHKGLTPDDVRIPNGSYEFFTIATESLLLTCSAVVRPDLLPREAVFRDTLASGLNYDFFENVEAVDGRKYWHVLLLHNYERRAELDQETGSVRIVRMRDRPGFAKFVVPTRDAEGRIWETSLFEDHPKMISQLRGLVVEDVPELKAPKRKQKQSHETKETGSE